MVGVREYKYRGGEETRRKRNMEKEVGVEYRLQLQIYSRCLRYLDLTGEREINKKKEGRKQNKVEKNVKV